MLDKDNVYFLRYNLKNSFIIHFINKNNYNFKLKKLNEIFKNLTTYLLFIYFFRFYSMTSTLLNFVYKVNFFI